MPVRIAAGAFGPNRPARDLYVFLHETAADVPQVVRRSGNPLAKIHLERARSALSGARLRLLVGAVEKEGRGQLQHVRIAHVGRLPQHLRACH